MLKFSANDNYAGGGDGDVWTWNERYGHGDLRISTTILRLGHPLVYSGYKLFAHTATGGYEEEHSPDLPLYEFHGRLGGRYHVRWYLVRVPVAYPEIFDGIPFVWGVGHNSIGWSGSSPNYESGFSMVVPGSQSPTGCTLQTFVYEVFRDDWSLLGWYPCEIEDVSLEYKVWGVLKEGEPERPDGPKVESGIAPYDFALKSAYPNPFNGSILIEFSLPSDRHAVIDIFDVLGRKICTLLDAKIKGGQYSVIWTGKDNGNKDVASGIYFCRLDAGGISTTKKLSLLR